MYLLRKLLVKLYGFALDSLSFPEGSDVLMEPTMKVESIQEAETNDEREFEVEIKIENESEFDNLSEPIGIEEVLDCTKTFESNACDVCQAEFTREDLLESHMQIHFETNLYPCKLCKRSFSTPDNLNIHLKKRHPTNALTCNKCDKIMKHLGQWKTHINTHVGLKPFTCNSCFRKFTQKISLRRHMFIHTGAQKPFKCSRCDKSYGRGNQLKQHEKRHDLKHNPPFACDSCGKGYAKKNKLIRHIRYFHTARSFPCNICRENFRSRYLGDVHDRIQHKGMEKPRFICDVCGKTLAAAVNMRDHMRLHNDDKPHVCEHCGKRFVSDVRLKGHSQLHSGVKLFSCDKCGKRFSQKGNLTVHLQLHLTGSISCSKKLQSSSYTSQVDKSLHLIAPLHAEQLLPASSLPQESSTTLSNPLLFNLIDPSVIDNDHPLKEIKQELDIKIQKESPERLFVEKYNEFEKKHVNDANIAKTFKEEPIDVPIEYDSSHGDDYNAVPPLEKSIVGLPKCDGKKLQNNICNICGKNFGSLQSLYHHIKSHSDKKPSKPDSCNRNFNQKVTLMNRQIIRTGEKFSRDGCSNPKQITQKKNLKNLRVHGTKSKSNLGTINTEELSKEPIDVCQTFGAEFIRNHNITEKNICLICGKNFKGSNSLVRHVKSHSGEKPYKCELCDRGFHQKGNLLTHQITHNTSTGDQAKLKHRFTCDLCPKRFTRKKYLKEHIKRVHTTEKHENVLMYTCSYCVRSYKEKKSLKIHMRNHTGERPYACSECEKSFTKSSTLKVHMRKHSGERTHPCEKCGATFSHPSALGTHDKSVHAEKSHVCHICAQKFSRKDSLTRHLRCHSGEKPFKCEMCKKSFACRRNYEAHQLTHGDGKYKCDRCNEVFTQCRRFYLHLKSHAIVKPMIEIEIIKSE